MTWSIEAEQELRRIVEEYRLENNMLRGILHEKWRVIRKLRRQLKECAEGRTNDERQKRGV